MLLNFGLNRFDLTHILRDFGTEVGAIDNPLVAIGISAVGMIPVKDERRTGFDGGFKDEPYQLFNGDFAFGNTSVIDAIPIAFFPFFAVKIFQRIALYIQNFVRAHEVPRTAAGNTSCAFMRSSPLLVRSWRNSGMSLCHTSRYTATEPCRTPS